MDVKTLFLNENFKKELYMIFHRDYTPMEFF